MSLRRNSLFSSKYNSDGLYPEGDERIFKFASMAPRHIPSIDITAEKVTVTDKKGTLLVMADMFENIEHKNLGAVESILTSAKITNSHKSFIIRLKQDDLNLYRIEDICSSEKPLKGQVRVIKRQINGKLYNINIFTYPDDIVDIEIVPEILSGQNVA